MERLIIDTDPGVDDAQAIMLALAHPGARVEALTIVAGNVGLGYTVANAGTVLELCQADVPVYAGCERALVWPAPPADYVHGRDGLGDIGFPPPSRAAEGEHAAVALVRLADESPSELTLVALGPLTNVAIALRLDPRLPEKLKRLVVMGGAIRAVGNTVNVSAEFNIFSDPEAAHIVFEQWPAFDLISWETTLAHPISAAQLERWRALGTPRARFFDQITRRVLAYTAETRGEDCLYTADPLTMAVAIEPRIVARAERHHVSVELIGRYTRGQTTVDWQDQGPGPRNAHIILDVDFERYLELMTQALAT